MGLLVLSLVLSIPVSLAVNLITPKVGNMLGRYSVKVRERRQRRKLKEQALAEWFSAETDVFGIWFILHIVMGMGLFVVGMLFTIFAFALMVLSEVIKGEGDQVNNAILAVAIFAALASSAINLRGANNIQLAKRMWKEVREGAGWSAKLAEAMARIDPAGKPADSSD